MAGNPDQPWSELVDELLSIIANSLTSNPVDVLTFRSVCKSWKNLVPATPYPIYSLLLPITTPTPPVSLRGRYYPGIKGCLLSITTVYFFHPRAQRHPWICFIDQWNKQNLSIRLPFSDISFLLPDNFPRTLNFLDLHASELGRFINLTDYVYYPFYVKNQGESIFWSGDVIKVIVLSNLPFTLILTNKGKLGLVRLGENSTEQWKVIHDGKKFRVDDIVEFKGKLLGVDRRGRVCEIGLDNIARIDLITLSISGGVEGENDWWSH